MVVPEKFEPGMSRQLERFQEALAGGMPRRGWKIGINVPEVLRRLDLPHPGVGWLDGGRVYSTGAELESRSGARLHVEPEVAVCLSEAVDPECSVEIARSCIATVHPALEFVNYAKPSSGEEDLECLTKSPLTRVGSPCRGSTPPRSNTSGNASSRSRASPWHSLLAVLRLLRARRHGPESQW